ncbi:MAG: hypothetical protein C4296_00780 [Gemmataceae bacterium]
MPKAPPKTFTDAYAPRCSMSWDWAGHRSVHEAFARAARRRRLAHAYLFVGPSGVGKLAVAKVLAQTLLCAAPLPDFSPCGQCDSCRHMAHDTHPDFHYFGLPPDRHEFPIAQVQDVVRRLGLKPLQGPYKIVVLDDADTLSDEAANALLKTLEEPPPASLLILLGASTDHFLATILSRCQIVRFDRLPVEFIARRLLDEGVVSDRDRAWEIAEEAAGSLERAQKLAQVDLKQLQSRMYQALDSPDKVLELAKLGNEFADSGSDSADKRDRARYFLELLVHLLDKALHSALAGQSPAHQTGGQPDIATRLATRLQVSHLIDLLDTCLDAEMYIDRRVQIGLVLDALAVELATRLGP